MPVLKGVELARYGSGPFAAMLLTPMHATVIRIERTPKGNSGIEILPRRNSVFLPVVSNNSADI